MFKRKGKTVGANDNKLIKINETEGAELALLAGASAESGRRAARFLNGMTTTLNDFLSLVWRYENNSSGWY